MKRWRVLLFIIPLLILFIALRLPKENTWTDESLIHYANLKESAKTGQIGDTLEGCNSTSKVTLAILPFFISFLGEKTAFYAIGLIFGLLTILFAFLLFRKMFGTRTALLNSGLLSVLPIFVNVSFMGAYGDWILLAFLFCGLYLIHSSITEGFKKTKAAIAGIILGSTVLFWSVIFLIIPIIFLAIEYILYQNALPEKKNKQHTRNESGLITFFGSLIAIMVISGSINGFSTFTIPSFSLSNLQQFWSYYFVFFMIAVLGIISYAKHTPKPAFVAYMTVILSSLLFGILFSHYFFLTALALPLLIAVFFEDVLEGTANKVFVGFFIFIILYLSIYYSFISWILIIPIVILIALTIYLSVTKRKTWIYTGGVLVLFLLVLFTTINAKDLNKRTISEREINAYHFVKTLPKDSCIITGPKEAGPLMAYGERKTYYHPDQITEDFSSSDDPTTSFLLGNKTASNPESNPSISTTHVYFLTSNESILLIPIESRKLLTQTGFILDIGSSSTANALVDENNISYELRTNEDGSNTAYRGEEPIRYLIENITTYTPDGIPGCLITENILVFIDEQYCATNLIRMIAGQDIQGLDKVYAKDGITVYNATKTPLKITFNLSD